jgi:hypothetical protein
VGEKKGIHGSGWETRQKETTWGDNIKMEVRQVIYRCCQFVRFYSVRERKVTVKGKAIPLHAWTDPEGSRRLRFQDFKTFGT